MKIQSPACGTDLPAPVAPAAPTFPAVVSPSAASAPTNLQPAVDHEAMTIPQYMAEKQIEGVIDLQSGNAKTTAVSSLTIEHNRKYTIGKVVALGGMGAIMDAKDVNLRRAVAMKVMLEPDKVSKDVILRFIQEAQITSQLEHPSIVPVHELGVNGNGDVFYTMKFVKGRTLSDILYKIRKGDAATIKEYSLSHLLTIFQKICDAMAFAHSKSVIHRDLKPENVMVGDYGEVQVMDWGLAKVLPGREWSEVGNQPYSSAEPARTQPVAPAGKTETGNPSINSVRRDESGVVLNTMDGCIMGTPEFMSPEQALGKTEEIDERTDIYALGAVLYNILTLKPPVEGHSLEEILKKVSTGQIKKPTEYGQKAKSSIRLRQGYGGQDGIQGQSPGNTNKLPHMPDGYIPESLSAVVMKALDVDANRRYQAVKDLQREIESYQGGFATKAEKAGVGKQAALFIRRNKAAAIGTAAVLIIGITFGTRATIEGQRAQHALVELRETAPTFAAQAASLVENQKFDEAIEKIGFAIKLDGRNADYRLFRAHTLQALARLPEAAAAYSKVLALRGDDPAAKLNLDLCERLLAENAGNPVLTAPLKSKLLDSLLAQKRQADAVPLSRELKREADTAETEIKSRLKAVMAQPAWNREKLKLLPDGTFQLDLKEQKISDLSILCGLPISILDISGFSGVDLTHLRQLPLKTLILRDAKALSLDGLHSLPLEFLDLSNSGVTNLSSLQGMPLKRLNLYHVHVKSLRPLRGMPLEILECNQSDVESFEGLQGAPLAELFAEYCLSLCDISALDGQPLKTLDLSGCTHIRSLTPLAACTSVENLLLPHHISDIAFLRQLPNLKRLSNTGIGMFRGRMDRVPTAEDFWRLNGARLERQTEMEKKLEQFRKNLIAQGNDPERVPHWAFDAKGELAIYISWEMKCADISDLRGVAVTRFSAFSGSLHDLSPLAGAPLKELTLFTPCGVSDISPLRDTPLETLHLATTIVHDISAVRRMPLKTVILQCPVTDISPLADIRTLEAVVLPETAKNVETLRHNQNIIMISYRLDLKLRQPDLSATDFWKKYDAGEFRGTGPRFR